MKKRRILKLLAEFWRSLDKNDSDIFENLPVGKRVRLYLIGDSRLSEVISMCMVDLLYLKMEGGTNSTNRSALWKQLQRIKIFA